MNALKYEQFGGPITVQKVPIPKAPSGGVVVEVRAAGVCRLIAAFHHPLPPHHQEARGLLSAGPTGMAGRVMTEISRRAGSPLRLATNSLESSARWGKE